MVHEKSDRLECMVDWLELLVVQPVELQSGTRLMIGLSYTHSFPGTYTMKSQNVSRLCMKTEVGIEMLRQIPNQ